MPDRTALREPIQTALAAFASRPLPDAARELFRTLGYASERSIRISTPAQFCAQLDAEPRLAQRGKETLNQLTALHLLFQFSDVELAPHGFLFLDATTLETTKIHSYLFFAAQLPAVAYTRTELSAIAREINKSRAIRGARRTSV